MSRSFKALAVLLLASIHTVAFDALAQKKTDSLPVDPLEAAWVWLADAPHRDSSTLSGDLGPSLQALDRAMQQLTRESYESFPRIALAVRLSAHLATLPIAERGPLSEYLAANEDLAAHVGFLLGPRDDIPQAYRVLARLIEAHGERVAEIAPLAAAICAVHDQPADRRVNENTVPLIDPVELFGYYAANERAMHFSLADTPATVLIHLADAAGSIDEYDWARKRYGRDKKVGNRYSEINYDTRALKQDGVEKRVTEAGGYSLQSIRQLGGVCADQAYFALSVGKACGIPACYVSGKGGGVSHAWVGFLEQAGRRSARWNFTAGRYKSFEDTQGKVLDPQTGQSVPDAYLAIAAGSAAISLERRQQSIALSDAASRVGSLAFERGGRNSLTPEVAIRQLDLLESALRLDPGNVNAWLFARNLVASSRSTLAQKEHWTQAVDQLAAQSHPDFAFEFIAPIFDSERDLFTRFNLWGWAAERFTSRPDLAARARLAQTRVMVEQDRKPEAVIAARAVFEQHAEYGPSAIEALALAEQLLADLGRQTEVLDMYKQAFRKLPQPRRVQAAFLAHTSWYQVGGRYADLLDAAGEVRAAQTLRKRLDR